MDVAIAGGHGNVALRVTRALAARGDSVRSLIRNPDHAGDVEAAGAHAVLCDLEHAAAGEVARHLDGADAVVFAAGAGPGSGPERKRTVDLGAAVTLVAAAERAGVRRYLMVSSIGAQDPDGGPEAMRPYLRAKAEADAALPRNDVAAVLVACLDVPETIGLTFEAFAGDHEVELAVRALARGTS
jgi:nucleoside-diphosphate-sugar epimerase